MRLWDLASYGFAKSRHCTVRRHPPWRQQSGVLGTAQVLWQRFRRTHPLPAHPHFVRRELVQANGDERLGAILLVLQSPSGHRSGEVTMTGRGEHSACDCRSPVVVERVEHQHCGSRHRIHRSHCASNLTCGARRSDGGHTTTASHSQQQVYTSSGNAAVVSTISCTGRQTFAALGSRVRASEEVVEAAERSLVNCRSPVAATSLAYDTGADGNRYQLQLSCDPASTPSQVSESAVLALIGKGFRSPHARCNSSSGISDLSGS